VHSAEITGIAAADLVHDFLSLFLSKEPPQKPGHHGRGNVAHYGMDGSLGIDVRTAEGIRDPSFRDI